MIGLCHDKFISYEAYVAVYKQLADVCGKLQANTGSYISQRNSAITSLRTLLDEAHNQVL